MPDPDTISADYTLRPSELAATLALLVEARQPVILWGAPGSAKSAVAQQVAADAARRYVDVRALLLDPVDLRGIANLPGPRRYATDKRAKRCKTASRGWQAILPFHLPGIA